MGSAASLGGETGVRGMLARVSPNWLALVGSLILSWVAIASGDIVGRDGAFYLDIAQHASEQGAHAALGMFDWPWYAILLGATHKLLHLSVEHCAYLWSVVFLAGTSVLMVDAVRQRYPQVAGWACLVMLAMPAVNQFRYDIIRESGFWCFCMLALWLAMRWHARGGWAGAAAIHLAIGVAALFRLEAVVLLVALSAWQLPNLFRAGHRRAFWQFFCLPLLVLLPALGVLVPRIDWHSGRVAYLLALTEPQRVFASFNRLADQFGASLVNKYSVDEAGRIVFFGLLASLLIKFVNLMGPFALPFLWPRAWQAWRTYWREFRPFAWGALLYFVVMMLFFVNAQFMNGRYLSFLDLLVVPLLALALSQFATHFPRLGKAVVAIGVLVMISNVVSLGTPKTHYIAAGHWLAEHVDAQAPVYYEDGRIAWYAGRGYPQPTLPRETAMAPGSAAQYRYFVVEGTPDEPWLQSWMRDHGQRVLAQFANRKGKTITVLGP